MCIRDRYKKDLYFFEYKNNFLIAHIFSKKGINLRQKPYKIKTKSSDKLNTAGMLACALKMQQHTMRSSIAAGSSLMRPAQPAAAAARARGLAERRRAARARAARAAARGGAAARAPGAARARAGRGAAADPRLDA